MTPASAGSFVWYEIQSPDPAATVRFYTDVVGWKTEPFGGEYTMFASAQGPLGGVALLTDQMRAQGVPPYWAGYVQVTDAAATVAEAVRLGGRIWREPTDYPEVGRLAVVGDPQGGAISLVQPPQPMQAHDPEKPGEFTWRELITTDHEAAFQFYSQLFGWRRSRDLDMSGTGNYLIYGDGTRDLGGMYTKPAERPGPPGWLYYVETDALDTAMARARARKGRILNGPVRVPGGARVAQIADPHGAMFALHEIVRGR